MTDIHIDNPYSADETMVAYKGTRAENLRQYVKNKPNKWDYKFFVSAGNCGYVGDFIPYQGTTTFEELGGTINELTETESDLGFGASFVVALAKSLSEPKNTSLFLLTFWNFAQQQNS
ncbi:hypothetical protein HHI36_003381 [Cryptolaemus montrouzieri]|uniref:Uncharacterized protein n=1 Tax=Cryptolaemus montrouzieri TaxID=559131 RepID=A0ABD2PD96_9CUCU